MHLANKTNNKAIYFIDNTKLFALEHTQKNAQIYSNNKPNLI